MEDTYVYDVLGIDKEEFISKYNKYEDEIFKILFKDRKGRAEVGERFVKYLCNTEDDIDRTIKGIVVMNIIYDLCGAIVGDIKFLGRAMYYAVKAYRMQGGL